MLQQGGLYEEWRKSITPTQTQIDSLPEGDKPYGDPSITISSIHDQSTFSKLLRGNTAVSPASDTRIKEPGGTECSLPEGYEHLQELLDLIISDQKENNPLFKHSAMLFTFRQTVGTQNPPRRVHIDPPRTQNSVAEDDVYFVSNKEGTLTQSAHVKNPRDTLNRMKPEIMIEQGLLNQAEPFELRKGTQNTYHVQGADTYTDGRTFVRMIVSHPDAAYFHGLSNDEKSELPEKFRTKHGIVLEDNGLTIA